MRSALSLLATAAALPLAIALASGPAQAQTTAQAAMPGSAALSGNHCPEGYKATGQKRKTAAGTDQYLCRSVVDPTTGMWYLKNSNSPGAASRPDVNDMYIFQSPIH